MANRTETDRSAAYALDPSDGVEDLSVAGFRLRWLARGEETAGLFNLMDYTAPPGFGGPALHVHPDHDESFFVVAGRLTVQIGDDRLEMGPGGFAWGPRGTEHTFANFGEEPARFLFAFTPSGMEQMFREMHAYLEDAAGGVDPRVIAEINERHGVVLVGPPMTAPEDRA